MIDLAFVTRLGLLLVRPGFLIGTAPPFGGRYTPIPVKVGLSVILGIALAPTVAVPAAASPTSLVVVLAREAAIGLALALGVRLMLAGAELAGQLAGFQLGFAYAATVDPQTGARNNVVASIYSSLTLLTFLGVNGHHAMLRALADSYDVLPIGLGGVGAGLGQAVAAMLGFIFVFGTQVAAPVVVALLVTELAVALLSHVAPVLNMMVVGFPVRLLAGLVALAATVGVVPSVTERLLPPALELASRVAYAFR